MRALVGGGPGPLTGRWARIRVPHDAAVDYEGVRADWKQPVYRAPRHGRQGGPRIRITGTMGYGRLTIKHSR